MGMEEPSALEVALCRLGVYFPLEYVCIVCLNPLQNQMYFKALFSMIGYVELAQVQIQITCACKEATLRHVAECKHATSLHKVSLGGTNNKLVPEHVATDARPEPSDQGPQKEATIVL